MRRRERRRMKKGGGREKLLKEGLSELHSLCCSAEEMHGRALFSNACLGVVYKGEGLAENGRVRRGGGLVRGNPSRYAYARQLSGCSSRRKQPRSFILNAPKSACMMTIKTVHISFAFSPKTCWRDTLHAYCPTVAFSKWWKSLHHLKQGWSFFFFFFRTKHSFHSCLQKPLSWLNWGVIEEGDLLLEPRMSFGPGDIGSTQYWHRQSFPLKVTLSPAGKGRLGESDSNNRSRRQRHEP